MPSSSARRSRARAERASHSTPVGAIAFGMLGVVGLLLSLMIALDPKPPEPVYSKLEDTTRDPVELERIRDIAVERDHGDAEAKRRELESGLIEAEQFATRRIADEDPARFTEILERWQSLRDRAIGTHYAAYVQTKIDRVREALDKAASEFHDNHRFWLDHHANTGAWDECFATFERYPPAFREAAVWSEVQALHKGYEERRRAWERATVRCTAHFNAKPYALEKMQVLQEIETVQHQNTLKLVANNKSGIALGFVLDNLPRPLYLRVTHLTSLHKGRHISPVTITINDRILVGDWNPSELNYITTIWDISSYVRKGPNVIAWQLGDARTHYWLKKIEISDWLP